jgi:hypothetical protein
MLSGRGANRNRDRFRFGTPIQAMIGLIGNHCLGGDV